MDSTPQEHDQSAESKKNKSLSHRNTNRLVVVGIGASAGGLESIERFFENIDEQTGAAFVVIQHLSPDFKSFMPEILSKKTPLQVLTATDRMLVRANTIYLMPPRTNLVIEDNVLYLNDIERTRMPNKPIDLFFQSLAKDVGDRSVAVVLSGTGTDGAEGVKRINAAGGRVFVESPGSAKFEGMPAAAIANRVHDGQGTPFEIAGEIFETGFEDRYSSTRVLKQELIGDTERVRIFEAIEARYGVDFSRYKLATVNRRIDRRMTELGLADMVEYWEYIQAHEMEVTTLYYEMLIGVTRFFRDPEAFDLLKTDIRRIVEGKNSGEEVRVWSAGCASGEETYSLAILFSEEIKRSGKSLHLKVFATDIDDEVLARASAGVFRNDQMSNVPKRFIAQYFNDKKDRYKVNASLRSRVVFARHNIMNDPPFAKLDMITCRNLLIYLDNSMQRQVLSLFYFSLNPHGVLFLGPSESLGKYEAGYEIIDSRWKIFSKSDNTLPSDSRSESKPRHERAFPVVVNATQRDPGFAGATSTTVNADGALQALMEQYVPSGLLVDESQNLLHVFGVPPFALSLKPGRVDHSLRSYLDDRLCSALSMGIKRAAQEGAPVELSERVEAKDGKDCAVDFSVIPVLPRQSERVSYFLITFEELQAEPLKKADQRVVVDKSMNVEQVLGLEEELKNTRQQLQATIEELQSTNEELQASNEELHSVNEELYTVNAEYQSKITDLNQLSMDEEHLFRSTGVGTIFLDQERRIRKFTPTAAELFNLLSQDQGRPFDHVTHMFSGVNFSELVERAIQTQDTIEVEVSTRDNEPHIVKLVPYQNDRNEPDGVVLSFVSTMAVKHAEQLYKNMFQHSPVGILGLTPEQRIESMNPSLRQLLGYDNDELLGQELANLFAESQENQAVQVVRRFIEGDMYHANFAQVASSILRRDGSELPVEISINSVPAPAGRLIHLYVIDMTERQRYVDDIESHRAELEKLVTERTFELEQSKREYEDLYENAPDMYASISANDATVVKCNERLARVTGYDKSELIGKKIFDLYHPDAHAEAKAAFRQFVETGSVRSRQLQLIDKAGKRIPVLLNVDAIRDADGNVVQSRSTWTDISDVYALKRENRTFLLATRGSDIGIWDWEFESGRQHWSSKFHELLGYHSESEHLTFDRPDIVHAGDKPRLTKLFKAHFAGHADFDIEIRLRMASGDYRWFHLQGKAVRNEQNRVTRMVGSAQDVHAARNAQEELRAQATIYSFITQETNDGWWDWHTQSDYQYMSPRFWETFGIDPRTKAHRPEEWQNIIHPDDLKVALGNFKKHSESRGSHPYFQEARYKHADGSWVTVLCRGRVIEWNGQGEPVRMVGVHTDISQLKQQEEQLKEINAQLAKSNEDLEQFAYVTSHDLKAPLRGITTLVGFMEEDLEGVLDADSEEAKGIRTNLRRLARQAMRMEGLISGILDYSRVDSMGSTIEDVDVRELLLDIAIDHHLEVGGRLKLGDELPILRTDPIMFEQVLGNLISNAVKFHPDVDRLQIRVDCEQQGAFYEFSVTDNGPGIHPNFHERIFDMFQTLNSKDSYESTGIGLTLVKRIVEKFDGSVAVDSTEGQGATMLFTWPASIDTPVV